MIDSLQWWALVAVAAGTALVAGGITLLFNNNAAASMVCTGMFLAVIGLLTFWFLSVAEDIDV